MAAAANRTSGMQTFKRPFSIADEYVKMWNNSSIYKKKILEIIWWHIFAALRLESTKSVPVPEIDD